MSVEQQLEAEARAHVLYAAEAARQKNRADSLLGQLEAEKEWGRRQADLGTEMATLLDWIESECERMEEYHTGFRWIRRRIVGLKVDAGDSFPESQGYSRKAPCR